MNFGGLKNYVDTRARIRTEEASSPQNQQLTIISFNVLG